MRHSDLFHSLGLIMMVTFDVDPVYYGVLRGYVVELQTRKTIAVRAQFRRESGQDKSLT